MKDQELNELIEKHLSAYESLTRLRMFQREKKTIEDFVKSMPDVNLKEQRKQIDKLTKIIETITLNYQEKWSQG